MQIQLVEGAPLPDSEKAIRQENINLYAKASRDFNPIHIDPEFAKKTEFGGIVAHGMLVLATISSYLTSCFGEDWINSGHMNMRFKAAAKPGDRLITGGQVVKVEEKGGSKAVLCNILCRNQNNEAVITGEARFTVRNI